MSRNALQYLVLYVALEQVDLQTVIGVLHDTSWKHLHDTYDPSLVVLQLTLREIQLNTHSQIIPHNIRNPISNSGMEKWTHVIVLTRCKAFQRLYGALQKGGKSIKPTLVIALEYCSVPGQFQLSSVYLKLAQDCPRCFQRLLTHWLTGEYTQDLAKYNGDQLNLLAHRNLAAKRLLQTRSFKLSIVQFPPLLDIVRDQNGSLIPRGMYIDLLNDMVREIQVNYTLIFPVNPFSPASIGGFENGTWTQLSGMVFRREVDCVPHFYLQSRERNRDMDTFTSASFVIQIGILIPAPAFPHTLTALLSPFDYIVWVCLVSAAFCVAVALGLLNRNDDGRLATYGDQVLVAFQLLFSQGSERPVRHQSGRLVLCAWCIFALIFSYLYTSIVTSNITVPKPHPLIDSIADLAYTKPLKPMVFGWGLHDNLFSKHSEGPFSVLYEHFAKHHKDVEVNPDKGVKRVLSGQYAMLASESFLRILIDQEYKKHHRCDLTVAKEFVSMELVSWIFPKNSATSVVLNLGFLRVVEYGLQGYSVGEYKVPKYCLHPSDFIRPNPVLDWSKTQSSFAIIGIGFLTAAIVFLTEIVTHAFLAYKARYPLTSGS